MSPVLVVALGAIALGMCILITRREYKRWKEKKNASNSSKTD